MFGSASISADGNINAELETEHARRLGYGGVLDKLPDDELHWNKQLSNPVVQEDGCVLVEPRVQPTAPPGLSDQAARVALVQTVTSEVLDRLNAGSGGGGTSGLGQSPAQVSSALGGPPAPGTSPGFSPGVTGAGGVTLGFPQGFPYYGIPGLPGQAFPIVPAPGGAPVGGVAWGG